MGDPSGYGGPGSSPDRESTGIPRWLKLLVIALAVVVLIVVVMLLSGGMGGHVRPPH
jgi:hypothetical protein